jgi:hypothetical protein
MMKWHYAIDRKKLGPVEEAEFARLVGDGVITDATLVWTKGMPEWKPYAEVKLAPEEPSVPSPPPSPPAEVADQAKVRCVACERIFPLLETVRFGDQHVCLECRPAYIERRQDEQEATDSGDVAVREERLTRERMIRTVGALILLSVGVGILFAGREVHQLRGRAKLAVGIVSGLGLLTFPIGTLINAYVLYLAFTESGRAVLTAEHREVIAGTPEVQCRISWIAAVLMAAGMFLQIAKGG